MRRLIARLREYLSRVPQDNLHPCRRHWFGSGAGEQCPQCGVPVEFRRAR